MPADNRAHLAAASQRRASDARKRARSALRRLDQDGIPVTFVAVANAAKVSRALLYRDPDLRAEVELLRTTRRSGPPRLPATQRATEASLRQRLQAVLDDVRNLRAENHKLRGQIAVILGEQRTAAVSTPAPRRSIGPCS
jgi:hypothetical protein